MKLIVNDLAVEYRDEGFGKTILFLHGWGSNFSTFDGLINTLENKYRVVRVDLPGFGKTEAPEKDWDLSCYAKFVREFIKKSEIEPEAIIGHSFGGRIAVKGVSEGIFECSKLVLISSAGTEERGIFLRVLMRWLAKIVKCILYIPPFVFWRKKIRRMIYKMIGSDYEDAGEMKEIFTRIISEDLSSAAKDINFPVLLIWGEKDMETPLKQGEKFLRLIKNSRLEVIKNGGHFIHEEKPQKTAMLIDEFL